jgi:hypothetical protein
VRVRALGRCRREGAPFDLRELQSEPASADRDGLRTRARGRVVCVCTREDRCALRVDESVRARARVAGGRGGAYSRQVAVLVWGVELALRHTPAAHGLRTRQAPALVTRRWACVRADVCGCVAAGPQEKGT